MKSAIEFANRRSLVTVLGARSLVHPPSPATGRFHARPRPTPPTRRVLARGPRPDGPLPHPGPGVAALTNAAAPTNDSRFAGATPRCGPSSLRPQAFWLGVRSLGAAPSHPRSVRELVAEHLPGAPTWPEGRRSGPGVPGAPADGSRPPEGRQAARGPQGPPGPAHGCRAGPDVRRGPPRWPPRRPEPVRRPRSRRGCAVVAPWSRRGRVRWLLVARPPRSPADEARAAAGALRPAPPAAPARKPAPPSPWAPTRSAVRRGVRCRPAPRPRQRPGPHRRRPAPRSDNRGRGAAVSPPGPAAPHWPLAAPPRPPPGKPPPRPAPYPFHRRPAPSPTAPARPRPVPRPAPSRTKEFGWPRTSAASPA